MHGRITGALSANLGQIDGTADDCQLRLQWRKSLDSPGSSWRTNRALGGCWAAGALQPRATRDIEELGTRHILPHWASTPWEGCSEDLWLRLHIKLFSPWRKPRSRTTGSGLTRAGGEEPLRPELEVDEEKGGRKSGGHGCQGSRTASLAGWLSAKLRVQQSLGALKPPCIAPTSPSSFSLD